MSWLNIVCGSSRAPLMSPSKMIIIPESNPVQLHQWNGHMTIIIIIIHIIIIVVVGIIDSIQSVVVVVDVILIIIRSI